MAFLACLKKLVLISFPMKENCCAEIIGPIGFFVGLFRILAAVQTSGLRVSYFNDFFHYSISLINQTECPWYAVQRSVK